MTTQSKGKILLFDLETTGFEANRGHILCAVAKWHGEKKLHSWRVDEAANYRTTPMSFSNDKHIVQALVKMVDEADVVVAYYGGYNRFDIPYLNTRAIANKVKPCATCQVIDPWYIAKTRLKMARNSMDAVAQLVGAQQKGHIPWPEWHRAKFGDSKALSKLLGYCKQDVRVLEDVYDALVPLMPSHPLLYRGKRDGQLVCPKCGHGRSRSLGIRKTATADIQRRQCGSCGFAFNGTKIKIKARSLPVYSVGPSARAPRA